MRELKANICGLNSFKMISKESSDTQKFPVLLSLGNCSTDSVINFCHILVLHNGMKETLNQIHSKFWIPNEEIN